MPQWSKNPPFVLAMKKMQELAIRVTRLQVAAQAQRAMTVMRAHQPPLPAKEDLKRKPKRGSK
jgi:hypothetical protein